MTFAELMVLLAVASVVLLVTLGVSRNWIDRQAGRSAVYEVQSHLQLARAHAVTRNQDCMFRVNDATRRVQVFDINDPSDTSDDILLAEVVLSPMVAFDRPDSGKPITLKQQGPSEYHAVFSSRGFITEGDGEIVLRAAGIYHKVSVSAAGGIGVLRWDGSSWGTGGL